MLLDRSRSVQHINPAAENLFQVSKNTMLGHALDTIFVDWAPLAAAIDFADRNNSSYTQHDLSFVVNGASGGHKLQLSSTVTPFEGETTSGFLVEFNPLQQPLRIAREERLLDQSQANRELIRNLAHEIKNPLGALRGAAQLLERELERPELHEYTQVIMNEADRLQSLMDRLLTPHRLPQPTALNIHEVTERVRSLILAEYPGIDLQRDYDASLPTLVADREQLIQAVLNIARNAAQAMQGRGMLSMRTRAARRVTLAKKLHPLAISLQIVDNGPGIPEQIRDRVFFPLVSGREGGTGLGLTLAQTFVNQHQGVIEVESQPGHTVFTLLLPLRDAASSAAVPAGTTRH
ncbi:MAG: PAS domain-containing sensor histidine kinase [Burkholderiales bacterium]|nr:PAS domain-containing sensor histidine kinase [Burkholderiales bacterium]